MALPNVISKHKKISGHWGKNQDDGLYYWFEESTGELILPENVEHVTREAYIIILFASTVDDNTRFNKQKKLYFKQTAHVKIKADVSQNIWLFFEPKIHRYFIRDLSELGFTMPMPLFAIDVMSYEATEPEPITFDEFRKLSKETYAFNSVSTDNLGNITDYVTEV
jgi:hypothetical protein